MEQCVKQVEKPNSCTDFGARIGTLSKILLFLLSLLSLGFIGIASADIIETNI